jgi:DNA-directed RNA polymerase subunit RPC12/RpoP
MSIRFDCESCGQHLEADETTAGQVVLCTHCGKQLTVPPSSTVPKSAKMENTDISFRCDRCGQSIVIDAAGAGANVECPNCHQPLRVPATAPKTKTALSHWDLTSLLSKLDAGGVLLVEDVELMRASVREYMLSAHRRDRCGCAGRRRVGGATRC